MLGLQVTAGIGIGHRAPVVCMRHVHLSRLVEESLQKPGQGRCRALQAALCHVAGLTMTALCTGGSSMQLCLHGYWVMGPSRCSPSSDSWQAYLRTEPVSSLSSLCGWSSWNLHAVQ